MGEAKRRGSREERVAAAKPKPPAPERQYQPRLAYSNKALNFLWGQYRVGAEGKTVAELRAEAIAEQKRLAAEREASNATV